MQKKVTQPFGCATTPNKNMKPKFLLACYPKPQTAFVAQTTPKTYLRQEN